jgi:hypothetical protein
MRNVQAELLKTHGDFETLHASFDGHVDATIQDMPEELAHLQRSDRNMPFIVKRSTRVTPDFTNSVRDLCGRDAYAYYMPDDAVIVFCHASIARRLKEHFPSDILYVTPFRADWKPAHIEGMKMDGPSSITMVLDIAAHGAELSLDAFASVMLSALQKVGIKADLETTMADTHSVALHLQKSDVRRAAALLRGVHRVLRISLHSPAQIQNATGTRIVATGLAGQPVTVNPYKQYLNGSGEVVFVSDSGMDVHNCYLTETNINSITTSVNSFSTTSGQRDAMRKVVGYWQFMDSKWVNYDHGTHVTGTVAGYPPAAGVATLTEVGMAFGAKLVFADLSCDEGTCMCGKTAANVYIACGCSGYVCSSGSAINAPVNKRDYLFPFGVNNGAYVSSHSWGSSDAFSGYSQAAQDLDLAVANNPALLPLFAAGNDGTASSLTDQAVAKNVLAVGSSETSAEDYLYSIYNRVDWSWDYYEYTSAAAWQSYVNSIDAALLSTESLSWFSSMGPTTDNRIKPEIVAPGNWIISARGMKGSIATATDKCGSSGAFASYASPTRHTGAMQGTSMATPQAAGFATIVRQWVRQNYPNAAGTPGTGIANPPGSLLKALIINSAQPMTGYYTPGRSYNNPLQLSPGNPMQQGYGRVMLENIIPLPTGNGYNDITTTILGYAGDGTTSVATGATKTYQVFVTTKSTLRITLCWTDPAAASTASKALVNDLDLKVTFGTQIRYGNDAYYTTTDRLNNCERVLWANSPPGIYTVTVTGYSVTQSSPQPFSLVATTGTTTFVAPTPQLKDKSLSASMQMSPLLLFVVALLSAVFLV